MRLCGRFLGIVFLCGAVVAALISWTWRIRLSGRILVIVVITNFLCRAAITSHIPCNRALTRSHPHRRCHHISLRCYPRASYHLQLANQAMWLSSRPPSLVQHHGGILIRMLLHCFRSASSCPHHDRSSWFTLFSSSWALRLWRARHSLLRSTTCSSHCI